MKAQNCFHCGEPVRSNLYKKEEKLFCCNGCLTVHNLLLNSGLKDFYTLESQAGIKPTEKDDYRYNFLDVPEIQKKYISFENEEVIHTTIFLPKIHCSSCIYLLENIAKIESRIVDCQVNFTNKEAHIVFEKTLKFSELASLLNAIGYTPNFEERETVEKNKNKVFLAKIGIAGFAFGSIMLWSFPEYLGIDESYEGVRGFTAYLSFLISIPVLLFSANDYFKSAFKAIKFSKINIDVPITMGIIALYAQSTFHIFVEGNPGYMDSFAGFIFFLLIGKWFQNITYQSLSFNRNNKSYFPIAVLLNKDEKYTNIKVEDVQVGDTIVIRNNEIFPFDSVLIDDSILIDYSFVTGESEPVKVLKGCLIYAGGRLKGQRCSIKVSKKIDESRLTQLWSQSDKNEVSTDTDKLSLIFLFAVLFIAILAAIIWSFIDPSMIVTIIVSILIVACPCAIALSRPFTLGNVVRKMGKKGFYLKNIEVVDAMNSVTDIVFDKTGTLTESSYGNVKYVGEEFTPEIRDLLFSIAASSSHPISIAICNYLLKTQANLKELKVDDLKEISGKGIEGVSGKIKLQLGSKRWLEGDTESTQSGSVIIVNKVKIGTFYFSSKMREGVADLITKLSSNYKIHILSGDSSKDQDLFESYKNKLTSISFNQSPEDKVNFIQNLKELGKNVMMIGDGLNDSAALTVANVGVAISEDIFQFTPKSDAILNAKKIYLLNRFFVSTQQSLKILKICLLFSIAYNAIGLSFAIVGQLTPLVAAILMPLSSLTIVVLSTLVFTNKIED